MTRESIPMPQPAATLADVVDEVLTLFETRVARQSVWVHVDVPRSPLPMEKQVLKLTLHQMVLDALDQMEGGGDLSISAFVDQFTFEVEVADSAADAGRQRRRQSLVRAAHGRVGGSVWRAIAMDPMPSRRSCPGVADSTTLSAGRSLRGAGSGSWEPVLFAPCPSNAQGQLANGKWQPDWLSKCKERKELAEQRTG